MTGNNDILVNLFDKFKLNSSIVDQRLIEGSKYVASVNKFGNIGVCATLGVDVNDVDLNSPNFGLVSDRIAVNALVNSYSNYNSKIDGAGDIFTVVDFNKYSSIVMIGYFSSLAKKFEGRNIELNVFDLNQQEMPVLPMEKQAEYLSRADCIILTSTSISNNTFGGIVENSSKLSDLFSLGPSTPMDDLLFEYPQVKGLFGSLFKPFDNNPLQIIVEGGGTRQFMQYMEKVYRIR